MNTYISTLAYFIACMLYINKDLKERWMERKKKERKKERRKEKRKERRGEERKGKEKKEGGREGERKGGREEGRKEGKKGERERGRGVVQSDEHQTLDFMILAQVMITGLWDRAPLQASC